MNRKAITALSAIALAVLPACAAPAEAPATPEPAQVWLVPVPGGIAASSTWHGPDVTAGGRASGFTHDAIGAALAVSHITPRLTVAAGPDVSMPTLAQQCWGDIAAAAEQLGTALPRPDAEQRTDVAPASYHFRVIAGDPAGGHVVVSLLADTPQARAQGGFSRMDATLRWSGTDWLLQVPLRRPTLHAGTEGYALLGPTP